MQTERIIIENLKCHGCANTIKNSLKKISGVSHIDVVNESNEVNIAHDGSVDRAILAEKLKSLGYPETGESTLVHKAKSYVSCAIGRLSKEEN